jgi:nucleotide-binding universal stress UspA family protein
MPFHKILVAYDFSPPADRALLMATQLATTSSAALHLVHIHADLYDGRGDPSLAIPWPTSDQVDRYMRFLETELRRAVLAVAPETVDSIHYHVVRGEPVKRIEALADEIGADLICLGSTGKGVVKQALLGSVSQKVLSMSKVPVLTTH